MNNFRMYLEQELKIKLFENEVYQLKKQLEALKSTNKVLSEELTKDKILKQGIVNEILSKCKEIMGTDINVGTKGGE